MNLLGTLILNGPVFLGAGLVARQGLRIRAGLPRVLATAVLGWAWITIGMELLGSIGLLRLVPLAGWSLAGLLVGLATLWQGRRGDAETRVSEPSERTSWIERIALALVLAPCVSYGCTSLMGPVKVVSDAPIYHLYFAARWWQAGALELVPVPFGENAATYFPAAGDLWFAWLFAGWGGDRLAKIGQAPFFVLTGLAAYDLCRRLGASRRSSTLAVAWFLTSTPLLIFTFEGNVDTIFVAGYLAAIALLAHYALEDSRAAVLLPAALAAGAAWAVKPTGTLFVPPLLVLMGWVVLRVRDRTLSRRLAHLALVLGGGLALPGFWLGRNLALTGNPIYPLDVPLLGWRGWYGPDVMQHGPYFLPVKDWRALVDIVQSVLDPRLLPVWGWALLGGWSRFRKPDRQDRWVWLCAALAIANTGLYWLFLPYRTQQRFFLHAVGLAAVPLARLFDRGPGLRSLGLVLLGLHVLSAQGWPIPEQQGAPPWDFSPLIPNTVAALYPLRQPPPGALGWLEPLSGGSIPVALGWIIAIHGALLLLGLAVVGGWTWYHDARRGRALALALSATAVLACAGLILFSPAPGADPFYPPFRDFYTGWLELDRRTGPHGARIAYAGTNIPYYLLGRRFQNHVRYVNVDEHRDWLLHDYHRAAIEQGQPRWPDFPRPGWDRQHPDFAHWVENLRAERIQLLVVTRVNPGEGPHNVADAAGFPIERQWAESHPDLFPPLHGVIEPDPLLRIYRVNVK